MKYLHVTELPGGERYTASLREAATPVPCRGEVLIRVTASGVNRADRSQIAGRYPPPAGESEILGLEVSGIRDDTGKPVCALLAGGGHADQVVAPVGQVFPAPEGGLDLTTAAGIPEAFLTAFLNLVVEGGVAADARVLVRAGASGVGLAAIQIAKQCGARVAATTRSPEKLKALEAAGADLAFDTSRGDLVAELEARWGRDAVDVILDPVGAASVGVDLALLMKKRGRIVGSTLRSRSRSEKAAIVARFREEVQPGFAAGKLRVTVDSVFPVERAADAFQRMRENRNVGKIIIRWSGG